MAIARAHLFVSGHVQGVFFRESTRTNAQRLNVYGWVRNLPDGRVEAVFEGEREALEQLIAWAYQGPPYADVDHVEVSWQEPRGEKSFQVR